MRPSTKALSMLFLTARSIFSSCKTALHCFVDEEIGDMKGIGTITVS